MTTSRTTSHTRRPRRGTLAATFLLALVAVVPARALHDISGRDLKLPTGREALAAAMQVKLPTGREALAAAMQGKNAVRVITIQYVASNGRTRNAYVSLPAWYGPARHPRIPLVITPHGRGAVVRPQLGRFGKLPSIGAFAVVAPEGYGRRTKRFSWGYRGQIDDLARMPAVVTRAIQWLRIDNRRIYAFGTSMGGQETLLLAARHPRLLAGAAAFDSTVDLALQYKNFGAFACDAGCRHRWHGPISAVLQRLARREVGGSPATAPEAYAARSPLSQAGRLAASGIPLQLWWSTTDKVVVEPSKQSGALFDALRRLTPRASVEAFVGAWEHTESMRAEAKLPIALARFGLLPRRYDARQTDVRSMSVAPAER
jgi:poly(3-hydroxybutyrate) depolymerase